MLNILQSQAFPDVLTIQDELDKIDSPLGLFQPHHGHIGIWYSQLIGGFGFRTENSFQSNLPVQTTALSWQTAHKVQSAIGIDRVFNGNAIIGTEHRFSSLLGTKTEDSFWLTAPQVFESALMFDLLMMQQRLGLQSSVLSNWTFGELAVKSEMRWRFGNHYRMSFGMLNMIGQAPEDYGDRIGYRGGEIGYFSNSDTVFFQLDWVY